MRRPTFTYSAGNSSYYGGGNSKFQVRLEREPGTFGSSGSQSGSRCQSPNFACLQHSKVIVDQRSLKHIQDLEPTFDEIKCKSSDLLNNGASDNCLLHMNEKSSVIINYSSEMGTSCIKQDNCFNNSTVKATTGNTKIKDVQKVKQTDCENKIVPEIVSIEPCYVQNSKNNKYQHYSRSKMGCGVLVDSEVQVYNCVEPHKVSHNTVISVVDLQKPRKRKERQDSTSSITQERKLVRSNSEERINEVITNPSERIRRVVSHEDFKKYPNHKPSNSSSLPLHEHNSRERITESNYGVFDPPGKFNDFSNNFTNNDFLNDFQKYRKNDSSPARSRFNDFSPKLRISPNRDIYLPKRDGGNDSEDYECEHEKRRNSERFSRARLVPGRKAPTKSRKGSKSSKIMKHIHDENDYMNTSFFKEKERRSEQMKFVNKDYFYGNSSKKSEHVSLSMEKGKRRPDEENKIDIADNVLLSVEDMGGLDDQESSSEATINSTPTNIIPGTEFPWDQPTEPMPSYHSENFGAKKFSTEPLLSSEHVVPCSKNEYDVKKPAVVDHVVKMTECHARKYEYHTKALKDVKGSDLDVRDFITKAKTTNFLTPENRLKQITKRISSLKKKMAKYEENFEQQNGYRASQADKMADKNMKKVCSEMQKLRKEKMQLKIDPMSAILNLKPNGSEMDNLETEETSCLNRQDDMGETLREIEKRLCEKRSKCNRPFDLEQMTFNQLMDEKTAMQKALLYLESIYTRPYSREERGVAHPIYDRYRLVKRMVARGNSSKLNCSVSELQTILEHEAMDFRASESHLPLSETACRTPKCLSGIQQQIEGLKIKEQQTEQNNTNITQDDECHSQNNPCQSRQLPTPVSIKPDVLKLEKSLSFGSKIDESPPSLKSTDSNSNSASSVNDMLHVLPLDELKQQLILTRDEKKQLRRTIKEFEHDFEDINGRKIQKDDRTGMEATYALYKQIKAKLRLLQALVNKHKFN